jgi:transcriptional regulator with XRE-family HTH domain
MNVGRAVKEAREGMGMPVTVLARRTGVSRTTIHRIESGSRVPSMGLLERIAKELRVQPAELMRESTPPLVA